MATPFLNDGNTVWGDGKNDPIAPCPQAEKSGDSRAKDQAKARADHDTNFAKDRKKTSPQKKRASRVGPRLSY